MNDRRRAARHEAGHALVSWLAGGRPTVTLEGDGGGTDDGRVLPARWRVLVCLGGLAAEPGEVARSAVDLVEAVDAATALDSRNTAEALRGAAITTRELLALPTLARAHRALTRALLARRKLEPAEVETTILEALARPAVRYHLGDGREHSGNPPSTGVG